MKINPLGIQAYQHLNRQDRPPIADQQSRAGVTTDQPVVVEPQSPLEKSALAVKAPSGDYSKFLSPAEQEALNQLFARFSDGGRFGPGYKTASDNTEAEKVVGRMIDVKV